MNVNLPSVSVELDIKPELLESEMVKIDYGNLINIKRDKYMYTGSKTSMHRRIAQHNTKYRVGKSHHFQNSIQVWRLYLWNFNSSPYMWTSAVESLKSSRLYTSDLFEVEVEVKLLVFN